MSDLLNKKVSEATEGHDMDAPGSEGKGSKLWVPLIEDPAYFEAMSAEEIYDSFFRIRRMGYIANRTIRRLVDTKHIQSSHILEKRKKFKSIQRRQFEQMTPSGLEYLKVLLRAEALMLKNQKDRHLTPSASIKCRLAHMALDINSSTILARIYDITTPINIVTLEMWKILAADYVNNPMWQPSRAIDDNRLMEIDPSRAPDEKMSPEAVRAVFTNLRIDYSKALFKFSSALAVDGPHHPDQMIFDFWERWAKHDTTLFYLYMLFNKDRPLIDDCLLIDPSLMKQQSTAILMPMERMESFAGGEDIVRIEEEEDDDELEELRAAAAHHHHGLDITTDDDGQAAKRMRLESINKNTIPAELTGPQGAIIRDTAVANYCQRKTFNNEISFYLDMMDPTMTELIGENLQNHFMANFETLLATKMEDDYGDIIYN